MRRFTYNTFKPNDGSSIVKLYERLDFGIKCLSDQSQLALDIYDSPERIEQEFLSFQKEIEDVVRDVATFLLGKNIIIDWESKE